MVILICFLVICCFSNYVSCVHREAFDGNGAMDETSLIEPPYYADRKLQYQSWSPATCDPSAYTKWKQSPYEGVLINNPSFWRYQTQLQFVLSKGLALELAVAKCLNRFKLLQAFKAGKGGPVDIQNVWKAMCTDECLQSDIMHQDAMDTTGCTCLQLSTNSTAASYRSEGDWCTHNTARMLCDTLGFCGKWGCKLDDFMCPRYEWNKGFVILKGPGHCDRKSGSDSTYKFSLLLPLITTVTITVITLLVGM